MDADFDIRYTDRPITPFGGLKTVKNFYQNSGLQDVISSLPLPQPGSNRGYDPVDIVEGFLVSVILGARRLAHAGLLRHDKVVSEMFGWTKGMASESTFSRFFKKFDVDLNDEVFIELNRWWFTKLKVQYHTVDIDSTVITRYGSQDGVEVGYNPRKPGRGSHHPLIAFAAEAKMVIQSWMERPFGLTILRRKPDTDYYVDSESYKVVAQNRRNGVKLTGLSTLASFMLHGASLLLRSFSMWLRSFSMCERTSNEQPP